MDMPHPLSQNQWINSLTERPCDLSLSYIDIKVTPLSLKKEQILRKWWWRGGGGSTQLTLSRVDHLRDIQKMRLTTWIVVRRYPSQSWCLPREQCLSFWFRPECCSGSMLIFSELWDLWITPIKGVTSEFKMRNWFTKISYKISIIITRVSYGWSFLASTQDLMIPDQHAVLW